MFAYGRPFFVFAINIPSTTMLSQKITIIWP